MGVLNLANQHNASKVLKTLTFCIDMITHSYIKGPVHSRGDLHLAMT